MTVYNFKSQGTRVLQHALYWELRVHPRAASTHTAWSALALADPYLDLALRFSSFVWLVLVPHFGCSFLELSLIEPGKHRCSLACGSQQFILLSLFFFLLSKTFESAFSHAHLRDGRCQNADVRRWMARCHHGRHRQHRREHLERVSL